MTSRLRTAASTSRRQDPKLWTLNDSDSDRPRQTMAATQRHNIEQKVDSDSHRKHHTSSRRVDVSGVQGSSVPDPPHRKSSSRHRSSAVPSSSVHPSTQSQNYATSGATPGSTSQPRVQDGYPEDYHLRAYLKRRVDKRSPRSSNERVPLPEESRSSRPTRVTSSATPATVQAPASTQTYWIGPAESGHDPSTSRQHRDREKDREKDRERRREEKEKERARLNESERHKDRDKERDRERRKEKERERERSGRRDDRHREKEKTRDREGRRAEDRKPADRVDAPVPQMQVPSSSSVDKVYHVQQAPSTDLYVGQSQSRGQANPVDITTVPVLSSNSSTAAQLGTGQTVDNSYPSNATPLAKPMALQERDRGPSRHHRPHRDRIPGQQSGQESGLSSSEQEPSGRERYASVDRRYATRDYDGHPSGPSGSETERGSMKERRKIRRTHGDLSGQTRSLNHPDTASGWNQQHSKQPSHTRESPSQRAAGATQLPPTGIQTHTSVPPVGQPTPPVGLTSQRYAPQLVSIRAGQGPPDPQMSTVLLKFSSTATMSRQQEPTPMESSGSYEPHSRPIASQYPMSQTMSPQLQGITAAASYALAHSTANANEATKRPNPVPTSSQQNMASSSAHQTTSNIPSHGDASSGQTGSSFLHPVQQAIRSVEGIVRPSSRFTHRSATAPPAAMTTSQGFATNHPMQGHVASVVQQLQSQSGDQHAKHQTGRVNDERMHGHRATAHGLNGNSVQSQPVAGHSSPAVVESTLQYSHSPARPPNLDVHRSPAPANVGSHGALPNYAQYSTNVTNVGSVRRKGSASNLNSTARQDTSRPSHPNDKVPDPAAISIQYSTTTYPSYANGHSIDPRSPKPPSVMSLKAQAVTVAQATFPSTQPSSVPPQTKEAPPHSSRRTADIVNANISTSSPSRYAQISLVPSVTQSADPSTGSNPSGHSPSRNAQGISRSPAVHNAAPLSSTPKQSASARLHSQRNGSSDTITQSPAPRSAPNVSSTQQPLMHRSSATNLNINASIRPDTTTRPPNASSGYPEPARYRSPAPSTYPHEQAVFTTPVISSSTVSLPHTGQQYNASTPRVSSRAGLHPSNSTPSNDHANAQRAPQAYAGQAGQPTTQYAGSYVQPAPDQPMRPQDASVGWPSASNSGGQRIPPRSAPSPAPTITARQYHNVTSPSSRPSASLPSSNMQSLRSNAVPTSAPRRPDPTPFPTSSHLRAASDPHYGATPDRNAPLGNLATAHIKSRSDSRPSPMPEQDVLLTPSSLAPSMLPRQLSSTSTVASGAIRASQEKILKEKEPRKKGGFFGLFRSRSTQPKEETRDASRQPAQPRRRQGSAPAVPTIQSPTAQQVVPPNATRAPPGTMTEAVSLGPNQNRPSESLRRRDPSSTVTPDPAPVPVTGRKSPGSKMFTPFRLLSKRHRTVSAASVEAVDGTVANTVITGADSTRSSTAGRLSPPLRDAMMAAHEWRVKEADLMGQGTRRRRRPGVTFDLEEDLTEDTRPSRKVSRRQAIQQE